MQVSDFDFELPPGLIAQEPVPRGASRMLALDRASGRLDHLHVGDLPRRLSPRDLLVVNDTRVFPARLLGHRVPSGGAVECLLIGRQRTEHGSPADTASPAVGTAPTTEAVWEALMHPGQKLKPGGRVVFESTAGRLHAEVLERRYFGRRLVRFWTENGQDVDTLVDAIGHVPLPPYIHRADRPDDRERYQTVFARERGSVAAPTAGLHFTKEILEALDARGVERAAVTLHVGYGTFKPVRTDVVEEHQVDPEHYQIDRTAADALNRALAERRRIVAVGTTTTRALEHAIRAGEGRIAAGPATADLFIYPGFEFRVVSALTTNFHLPKSSLLMLVAAFAGRERVLAAYREAVAREYRFYSYGDAMLVL
jgi:S-adenosylmethionine:tRNA ribosyltransferase-isomerase